MGSTFDSGRRAQSLVRVPRGALMPSPFFSARAAPGIFLPSRGLPVRYRISRVPFSYRSRKRRRSRILQKQSRKRVYSRAFHPEYSVNLRQGVSPTRAKTLARSAGQRAVADMRFFVFGVSGAVVGAIRHVGRQQPWATAYTCLRGRRATRHLGGHSHGQSLRGGICRGP